MGVSAALLLKDIETFSSGVTENVPSAAVDKAVAAKNAWLASVEDLVTRGQDLRKRTEKLQESLGRFVAALAVDPSGVDLDEIIATLKSTEHDTKTTMAPVVQRIKATRKETFSMGGATPGERARAIAAVDRYIVVLNESLTMLRDFRWNIMALRAKLEESGDAPVFDDPEKLLEYLAAHSP